MAKRWFISRLDDFEGDGARVPKCNLYGANSRIWSKAGFNWCFGQLGSNRIADMQADADMYILPDSVMDLTVGDIPAGTRTTLRTKLENAGFTFTDVKTAWTIRQLLNYLANQLQANIDVERGDVRDQED